MVGFRMAGFVLSGSGIRAFVLGNMGLGWGGWGKVYMYVSGGEVRGGGSAGDGVWRETGGTWRWVCWGRGVEGDRRYVEVGVLGTGCGGRQEVRGGGSAGDGVWRETGGTWRWECWGRGVEGETGGTWRWECWGRGVEGDRSGGVCCLYWMCLNNAVVDIFWDNIRLFTHIDIFKAPRPCMQAKNYIITRRAVYPVRRDPLWKGSY